MTYLVIVWEFPPGPGGIGYHAFSVSKTLAASGHQVTILTTSDYVTPRQIQQFDDQHKELKIFRTVNNGKFSRVARLKSVINIVLRDKPARVLISGKGSIWLVPLVRVMGRSHIDAFLHGSELKLPSKMARYYTFFCLKLVHRLFPVSDFTKNLLPRNLQVKKIEVIPNGLVLDELAESLNNEVSKIHLIGEPSLLTVGQISKRKGQHRVIMALPELIKRWPKIHYHLVGLDTDRKRIIELAEQLGVIHHITIHGQINDRNKIFDFYKASDVFIMLSENQPNGDVEGFGIAILEANFFGNPAIGAKGCGIEDAIKNGVNGYLVDGNNSLEIVEAVASSLRLVQDNRSSFNRYVSKYDWKFLIKRLS